MQQVPFWFNPAGPLQGPLATFLGRVRGQSPVRPGAHGSASVEPGAEAPLLVEALDADAASAYGTEWASLTERSLEPNVFLEPGFALTAAQHFPPSRRPTFLFVWSLTASGGRRLLAVCPVTHSRLPLPRTATVWFHDLATLGAPLLDRAEGAPALRAILAWIAGRRPRCGALLIRAVPIEGPTAALLRASAALGGRRIEVLDAWERAVLPGPAAARGSGLPTLPRKRAKELLRQRRRLSDAGSLTYRTASGGDDLRVAVEQFLGLEARGWKGARGTALLMDASRAAFARTMTRLLARDGRCRVDGLWLDQVPIAIGIVLSSGGHDFFWKMAYDEDYAWASPGVQFTLDLTAEQRRRENVVHTDSCAAPDHPMIDRLWRDRVAMADLAIAVTPGQSRAFSLALVRERHLRRARSLAKLLVTSLLENLRRRRRRRARP